MTLDDLVESLLYEGYALYPYTPEATKNATPTPFGIVYPSAYAAECAGAYDHTRLECHAIGGTTVRATIRFLTPADGGHQAVEHRVDLGPIERGGRTTEEQTGARFTVRWSDDGTVRCCVHNITLVRPGLGRSQALQRSLVSVHTIVQIEGGRFLSPLEGDAESVNTWPVLV